MGGRAVEGEKEFSACSRLPNPSYPEVLHTTNLEYPPRLKIQKKYIKYIRVLQEYNTYIYIHQTLFSCHRNTFFSYSRVLTRIWMVLHLHTPTHTHTHLHTHLHTIDFLAIAIYMTRTQTTSILLQYKYEYILLLQHCVVYIEDQYNIAMIYIYVIASLSPTHLPQLVIHTC